MAGARRVGRSKSIEAQTYWSAGTASSAYARMVSSNLAGRDDRLAILQPGTERLAGDGAWWGVWLRVIHSKTTRLVNVQVTDDTQVTWYAIR